MTWALPGVNLPTKAVLGLGSASPNANTGNIIDNNNIFDFFSATTSVSGISVSSNCNNWTISNNRIYQTASRTFTSTALRYAGITLSSSGNAFTLTGNVIGFGAANGTGTTTISGSTNTFRGIDAPSVSTTTATSIQGNTISGINQTTATTGTGTSTNFVGIMLGTTTGRFDVGTVTGNTIGSLDGSSIIVVNPSAGSGTVNAIYDFSVSANNISNNNIGSITIGGTATGVGFRGILVNTSSTALATINNNTIANITDNEVGSNSIYAIQTSLPPVSITGNTVRNLVGNSNVASTIISSGIIISTTSATVSTVSQNVVHSLSNNSGTVNNSIYAIYCSFGAVANIVERNLVHSLSITSTNATCQLVGILPVAGSGTYKNNMVRLGLDAAGNSVTSGFAIYGMFEIAGTNNIYFNSVYVGGSAVTDASTTFAFVSNVASGTRNYLDNIFWNARSNGIGTGKHYAIALGGTVPNPAGLTSNYNDLYATGTGGLVGLYNAIDRTTLSDWQTATGQDGNSFSADPQFINPTGSAVTVDLHISAVNPTPIESSGLAIAGVTDDFDGQVRAAFTPTDIGADAGNFVVLDISPPAISYPPLGNTASTTNRIVMATISDATGVDSGANLPRIYFKKSTDASYVSTQCVMTGGTTQNGTYDCTIDYSLVGGGGVMANDVVQYFVVAQDTLGNLGSTPSGATGANVNSITFSGIPNSYSILATISGTFNVGSGGDYADIGAAVTALNNSVITGPVTFVLTDSSYTGAPSIIETLPVTINANPGSSSVNTVTFKPASGQTVTITGSSTGGLFTLNGADWVIIDGSNNGTSSRDLTITNTNAGTSSAVIWLQSSGADGATNNTIKNVNLAGNSNTTTLIGLGSGSSTIAITSAGTGNNNNTFQNCNISKTQYGIYSGGASAANKNTGNVISENLINTAAPDNVAKGGILAKFEDGVQIAYNTISGMNFTTSFSPSVFGIALGVTPSNTYTTFTGSDVTNAMVLGNAIGSVVQGGTGSAFGIVVNSVTSGTTLVANNMISGVSANTTPSDFTCGILAGGGTGSTTQVYFNSVSMTGSRGASTSPSYALAIGSGDPIVDVRDNILYNAQTSSSTGKNYAIANGSATFANMMSDYNDLFVSGAASFIGQTGGIGTSGTDRPTLLDWQTQTGKDANSISADPGFLSATDLHITSISPVANIGNPVGGITTDFDGNMRSVLHPDIGADEVVSPDLVNLVLSDGTLTPAFDPAITSYTADVAQATTSITVTPTALDSNATITVNGDPVVSGTPSDPIALAVGPNVITTTVTTEFGMPMQSYTVTVTRAGAPVVSNTNDSGPGSLRQALADASDGDVITFNFARPASNAPAGGTIITLTSGELVVDKNVTISGPGADVLEVTRDNMAMPFRIFHVTAGLARAGEAPDLAPIGVTIEGITISNGSGASGGGIYNDHSILTVDSCALVGNSASAVGDYGGGGIYSDGSEGGSATLTLVNSTLSDNSAPGGFGGGISNNGSEGGSATLSVANSTLSGNSSGGGGGGAIDNDATVGGSAPTTVSNSTLSGNSGVGGIYNNGALTLGNTIFRTGVGGNIFNDVTGSVTSLGYNLSNDGGGGYLTGTGDQINTDPILGPLKNNGGSTFTHAPLSNSPAIDRGKDIGATGRDQRGSVRPVTYDASITPPSGGDRSDIGAVELAPGVIPTSAVSRKTHGGAGDFDVNLPLTGPVGIECRSGGGTNDFQVIVTFATAVTFSSAAVNDGAGSVGSVTGNGTTTVTVNLTGVTNAQRITIALFGVDDTMNTGDVGVRMGVLLGDTNGDTTVSVGDVAQTKAQSGQGTDAANFRTDVNVNGTINAGDIGLVKSKSGTSLP